jgi:hypothetical protein
MSGCLPVFGLFGALGDGASILDEAGGTSTADAELASARFAARQEAMPVVLIGASVVDIAID